MIEIFGGAEENRTPDLLNAIQALSQLSYGPTDDSLKLLERHENVKRPNSYEY